MKRFVVAFLVFALGVSCSSVAFANGRPHAPVKQYLMMALDDADRMELWHPDADEDSKLVSEFIMSMAAMAFVLQGLRDDYADAERFFGVAADDNAYVVQFHPKKSHLAIVETGPLLENDATLRYAVIKEDASWLIYAFAERPEVNSDPWIVFDGYLQSDEMDEHTEGPVEGSMLLHRIERLEERVSALEDRLTDVKTKTEDATPDIATPSAGSGDWRTIKRWSGSGVKDTESFEVPRREWRISWQASNVNIAGVFQVYAYREDGTLAGLVANHMDAGSDVSYIRGEPGRYYLSINSFGLEWEIEVQVQD